MSGHFPSSQISSRKAHGRFLASLRPSALSEIIAELPQGQTRQDFHRQNRFGSALQGRQERPKHLRSFLILLSRLPHHPATFAALHSRDE
jgi:hypothetical protein